MPANIDINVRGADAAAAGRIEAVAAVAEDTGGVP
jgi:hypothetical protein